MIVCLDSDCTIYLVEQNPIWGPIVAARLAALGESDAIAVSDLVRTECFAGPLHNGNVSLVADYQRFFADPKIRTLPLTATVCERAARIRAATNFNLKVPDCLHLAAGTEFGCDVFLTHDSKLKQYTAISVEVLS